MQEERKAFWIARHMAFYRKYRMRVLLPAVLAAVCVSFAALPAKASRGTVVDTQLTNEGQNVTLRVKITGNTKVTSGRIKVFYPKKLLKLSEVQSGIAWRAMDTDTSLEEDGRNGISYAWADTKELTEGGTLLTVTMKASEKAAGQEIVIETEIEELFSREKAVDPGNRRISDRLTLDNGEEPAPSEPDPAPEISQTAGTAVTGTAVSSVRTGDDANPAGYALLSMGALLLLADMAKKKPN